jgi:hypothetical protein
MKAGKLIKKVNSSAEIKNRTDFVFVARVVRS